MGININVYTYFGVKIDWNDEFLEAYEEVYSDNDTPNVLVDDMCGEFIVLGIRLYDSGDFRYCEDMGNDDFKPFKIGDLWKKEIEYREAFGRKFPQFVELINQPFEIFSFLW